MNSDERNFVFVQKLLLEQGGIVLDDGKEYMVQAHLTPLAQKNNCTQAELVRQASMNTVEGRLLAQHIVEAMTVNETSFFRDPKLWMVLQTTILPELTREKNILDIWSAGASTGQEAYSFLMLSDTFFKNVKVNMLASDINHAVLEKGKKGEYTQLEISRGLPARYLVTYFEQMGKMWKAKDKLREIPRWQRINLAKEYPSGSVDLIFLRNVLIYLSPEVKANVLAKVYTSLKPGGYLIMGASENLLGQKSLERVTVGQSVLYKKEKR